MPLPAASLITEKATSYLSSPKIDVCEITLSLSLLIRCSMEKVVEGALDLIADTSKSGASLMITKEEGLKYVHT